MIQKYYNSILEQVFAQIGKKEHNIVLAKYSNDFSLKQLEISEQITNNKKVHFAAHEFRAEKLSGAYEPFLDLIFELFDQQKEMTFDEFLDKCNVYSLQRPIIAAYRETGKCIRKESLLYTEVDYERERMHDAIVAMLVEVSKIQPFMLWINRMQFAGKGTLEIVYELLKAEHTENIGIVLGMNEQQRLPEYMLPGWESVTEELDNNVAIFRIGNAGESREQRDEVITAESIADDIRTLQNLVFFMDFEQALFYLEKVDRRIRFENFTVSDEVKYELWQFYAYVSVYVRDLPKALEISESILQLAEKKKNRRMRFYAYYIRSVIYMYQSKLQEATECAGVAKNIATEGGMERGQFEAELVEIQAKMAGWNNIFFCAQNVEVSDAMIEKLIKYDYRNHLAYIYVYAYDNKPEIVAKAYYSESQLIYFSKGIRLATEIGNTQLIYNAYQKNIMLASSNGMYLIALLYSVRTFEALDNKCSVESGRIFSGIGYTLTALRQNDLAKRYFQKAVEILYNLELPEDIAEVYYNMAINCIAAEEFKEANEYLMRCMKAIERLHLNSLRVCNLSKLYGLLALCNQKLGNRFNCEQYLNNCKQFLNYIIEKEKLQNDLGIIHDYARCDDDMFLYHFTRALLEMDSGNDSSAFEDFNCAETHLVRTEGNQFFCYQVFRKDRIRFYGQTGRMELKSNEEAILKQYLEDNTHSLTDEEIKVLEPLEQYLSEEPLHVISTLEMEMQLKQESINRAYKQERRQMDFLSTWQKTIDVTDVSAEVMVENVMRTFLYHFNLDRALYIQYHGRKPKVLYDNTEASLSMKEQKYLKEVFEKTQRGFVVSKISSNYSEHLNVVKLFDEDNVCSLVAIPFFDNGKVTSIMIAYILMKDNWHSSVSRYMLDESDMRIYELLFREVQYALNRLYAYEKLYEMNAALYKSAVTDQLTGILNRKGFYQNIGEIIQKIKKGRMKHEFGIMFIDLDNFKGYNDTFGHDVGDLLLKSMANIFSRVCRDKGFVTRFGGDEFIIFLYTGEKKTLEDTAKAIYKEIKKQDGFRELIAKEIGQPVEIDDKKLLSCSIGIISSNQVKKAEDIDEMIKVADDLLYAVKAESKGTYKFFEEQEQK